jgi:dTDP-glucose 4,6-dehydratase
MLQALAGKPLSIYGDGLQTRSFCFVSDLIDGILCLAASDEHTPVNLGNPTEFTMLQCAEEVLRVTGSKSAIVHQPLPQDDPARRRPDITKARALLHWEPKVPLREGLQKSLAYFQSCLPAKSN